MDRITSMGDVESKDDGDFEEFVFIEELSLEFAYAQSGVLNVRRNLYSMISFAVLTQLYGLVETGHKTRVIVLCYDDHLSDENRVTSASL